MSRLHCRATATSNRTEEDSDFRGHPINPEQAMTETTVAAARRHTRAQSLPAWGLAPAGRYVFGVAAMMMGLSQAVWHGFATMWYPIPPEFPLQQPLVYLTAAMLVLGGLALFTSNTFRGGVLLIVAVVMFAEVFWLRRILRFPTMFGVWAGFAEQFAPVVGAMLCYLSPRPVAGEPIRDDRFRWARSVLRMVFGLCLISMGKVHIDALKQTAEMVPAWLPPGQTFWAIATGIAFMIFGVAIVAGVRARLAALLATAMLSSFALLVWLPRIVAHPELQNSWAGTAITLAVAGAAWMVADTLVPIRQS
jgi:uncharacterized membrane protein YphA (DoxX/SURF4 family)